MPDHAALTDATSRRDFLRKGAVAAVTLPAVAGLAACTETKAAPRPAAWPSRRPRRRRPRPSSPARQKADAMDAMHEEGIKAFPAKTAGKGNQLLAPRMESGVKVFELTAEEIEWEVEPGKKVKAWAYNGQVPGPQIRVREGDRVRVMLHQRAAESTAIHFHGLELPNDQDGVPFITQPPIKPGESFTYEFTVPNAGSHMYHSHHNAAKQVGQRAARRLHRRAEADRAPIAARGRGLRDGPERRHRTATRSTARASRPPSRSSRKQGQKVRIRFMNEGMMIHPMHLHGMHMTVIAKDGWDQPAPWKCDTLNIAPGERWDVIVKCTNPGTWAFHCHILPHAESEHGMFGMVTALVVQKPGVA